MPVLTGIDVLGIQAYVFASNRLRDVLAASWMVDHVVKRADNSLRQWGMTDDRILLAGGGNAILEFPSLAEARSWTQTYTRWLRDEAPGIEIVIAHRDYGGRPLAWGLKALAVDLAREKLERRPSAPQLGLGVTASCLVTGLPATSLDPQDEVPIARPIEALRDAGVQGQARKRWERYLPEGLGGAKGWGVEFPLELDLMGRSYGATSLMGVVHVDGNGVGRAIKEWLDRCLDEELPDDKVREQYREWSRAIDALGEHVLRAVIERVGSCVFEERDERGAKKCVVRGTPHELGFPLRTSGNTLFLPLRPILLGGDDLTFVCDGRIALDLAVAALRAFDKYPIPHLGENGRERTLTACAGVALVKAHAPFRPSYALAEHLCANAKRTRQDIWQKRNIITGCWLDWHVGTVRPGETVGGLRRREYQGGKLTMRPYPLVRFNGRDESWEWLDGELLGPGRAANNAECGFRGAAWWSESRSRVKRLESLVAHGSGAVRRQLEAWKAIEQRVGLPAGLDAGGFIGEETPLLDAIELLDLHLRLEPDPRGADHGADRSTYMR